MTGPRNGGRSGWELVAAARRGDRDAFGELYTRYAEKVSRYVGHRVPDHHLSQDLTSETFTRALRRIDSVSDQGRDVGAWFTSIAHNLLADHWKSARHQRDTPVAEVTEAPNPEPSPEQAVLAEETAAELRRHLAWLTPDQQRVLGLRFWQELSVTETAVVMGRNEAAVKGLQHRGIDALRRAMTPGSPGPVAPPREQPDPLAVARRAVGEVARHVAGHDPDTVEQNRAEQVGRWHTDDQAAARETDTALTAGGAA
jgi:RNA polymerase sigma-70 factor (ECF subfamily)